MVIAAISSFKSAFSGGGARPSRFSISLTAPSNLTNNAGQKFEMSCHSASLPESTVGVVPVYYMGRAIKEAGDRTFEDWQVSIYCDSDFSVRDMLESWSNSMNAMERNVRDPSYSGEKVGSPSYGIDILINQYDQDDNIIRQYTLVGAFPSRIGPIRLSWDATNQIETFDCTFSYDYWTPGTQTGSQIVSVGNTSDVSGTYSP